METQSASQLAERALEAHDLRGYQLAEQIGVSPATISRILNGQVEPSGATYRKLLELAPPSSMGTE